LINQCFRRFPFHTPTTATTLGNSNAGTRRRYPCAAANPVFYFILNTTLSGRTGISSSSIASGTETQIGRRWMARAAKLAVFEIRDENPFGRPMRSIACGGMRGTCHLLRMTVSSRDNLCDSVSKRSSSVATRLRVCASSD